MSIVLLSLGMGIGSFLAGSIPLMMPLSSDGVKLISTFSSGLLIGTALIVIIPEGLESVYQHNLSSNSFHQLLGIALALGFAFMLLIDTFSNSHSHGHVAVSNFRDGDSETIDLSSISIKNESRTFSTSLGLIIHCAADGLALGAAAASQGTQLEMLVFFAIMLHKAPSAFGLSTYLLANGQSMRNIRNTLIVFSSSAPVSALMTFVILKFVESQSQSYFNTGAITGYVLLFSGGTFLYVSTVHILPEIYASDGRTLSPLQLALWMFGLFVPIILSFGVNSR